MYGKVFVFFFSIVLLRFLITSTIQSHSNKIPARKFEAVMNQSQELSNKIENIEMSQQKKRNTPLSMNNLSDNVENRNILRNIPLKTPISVLQELLGKWKKVPTYVCTLDFTTGYFRYTVSFDDKSAEGQPGMRKQVAKQSAAKALLDKLAGRTIADEFFYNQTDVNNTVSDALKNSIQGPAFSSSSSLINNIEKGNFVGALQEFCVARLMTEPKYEIESESNVVGPNRFAYAITLLDKSATGMGAAKKIAKQNAAKAMLKLLEPQLKEHIGEATYTDYFKD